MRIAALVTLMFFIPQTVYAAGLTDQGYAREYQMNNRDNRLLVRIQLWGDIPNTGIYLAPDNATLLEALGAAGGLGGGVFSQASIHVARTTGKERTSKEFEVSGRDLVTNPTFRNMTVSAGDVIYVDAPQRNDNFGRTLSIVGALLGIVSTTLTIYLVVRK